MKGFLAVMAAILISGCNAQADSKKINGRYQSFEVPEYGIVCVSGGSGQLSCVKR